MRPPEFNIPLNFRCKSLFHKESTVDLGVPMLNSGNIEPNHTCPK